MMFILRLLIVTGITCAVYADKCKNAKAVDNFSVDKFSGTWEYGGFELVNPGENKKYENPQCGALKFVHNKGKNTGSWIVDMTIGGKKSDLKGNYTLPDPNKGFFISLYTAINVTFEYTVTCTDYLSWAASYSCAIVKGDKVLEFLIFLIRDPAMYDELVTREEIQKCFEGVTNKPVKEIQKVVHGNCPPPKF